MVEPAWAVADIAINGSKSEIVRRCFVNMVRLRHCWKRVMCALLMMSSEQIVWRLQAHADVKPRDTCQHIRRGPNAAPAKVRGAIVPSTISLQVTLFDREGYDEVTGKRPLRTLRSSAEWRGVVQGRVVANLRPDNETFELFWDGRLDGKSDGQRAVSRRSAADRHSQWIAMFDPDKVQVARERGDEETVIVAPNLSASRDLKPVVNRIGRVLRPTIPCRVGTIIANVVEVGRQGKLVGCFPDDGHVIKITESRVGIDAGEHDCRHIRIFRTDMGGCRNGQLTIQQIQAETTMESRGRVVVATIKAIEVIAEGRVHAGVNAQINIEHRVHMRGRHEARVLERNAEIENVGMRVKRIVRRVDDFRAFQSHVLSDLYVDAAGRKPRQMEQSVRFDDVELIALA